MNEYGLPDWQLEEVKSLARSPALVRIQKQALRAMLDKHGEMLDTIAMLVNELSKQHQSAQIGPTKTANRLDERKEWHRTRGAKNG